MLLAPTTYYTTIIIIQHLFTSVIGIIGNVLVLIVYRNKLKDNESVTFFICHLSLTDLACCLFLIPINCYHELNIGKIETDFMCKFHSFLNITNITYSCLLMTLVAFERFLSITYPLREILTKAKTKFTLTLLFTLCLVIALFGALSVGIYHKVYSFHSNSTYLSDLLELELDIEPNHSNLNQINMTNLHTNSKDQVFISKTKRFSSNDKFKVTVFTDSSNKTREKRNLKITNETIPFKWMVTNNCFPNDQLISINHFTYIRLFQNFIVVFCFIIIFILYAFICAFVSKRRYIKLNKAKYYNDIINRSRKNNLDHLKVEDRLIKSETTLTKNHSFINSDYGLTFDLLKNVDEQINKNNNNNILNQLNLNTSFPSDRRLVPVPKIAINDNVIYDYENPKEKTSDDKENKNQRSINLLSSSVIKLKSSDKILSINSLNTQNSLISKSTNNCDNKDKIVDTQNLNYSSILLANMKTAFMLFVVTFIMAVVYTPALLTSLGYIPYNPIYWNIIYINNAINPLIYSFMNSNFRKALKKIFSKSFKR